jgi:hypothetical protein
VALGLAEAGDLDGAVALSGLLETLPDARAWEIEAQLERLAGGKAPSEMAAVPIDWKNVARAWKQWWQGDHAKIVMGEPSVAASSGTVLGYTLLVQQQDNTITELNPDGKPRWTLTGLQGPVDAQVLANQHVLVAEQGRVTERDLSGKVFWKLEGIQPLSVQRLANGNTFIACGNLLVEVDRAGKDILRVPVGAQARLGQIVAARRLPDRRIVAFERGAIIQLDEAGREVKRTMATNNGVIGGAGCNEVLDNGHVLVSSPGIGNITEFDMDGKVVGSFDIPQALHSFRMPNGHTLALGMGMRSVELDENWKPIKETMLDVQAFRVKRR